MDHYNHEDEMDGLHDYMPNGLVSTGRSGIEFNDWSPYTTLGYDSRTLAASAHRPAGPIPHEAPANASLPLVTTGEFVPGQHIAFQHVNTGYPTTTAANGHTLEGHDVPLMDVLWPELAVENIDQGQWNQQSPLNVPHGHGSPSDSHSSHHVGSQSPDLDDDAGSRKRRRRIPPQAKRLLENCFERHRDDPYIPQQETEHLVAQTGLTLRQVRTFFANARARKLPRACQSESPQTQSIRIPARRSAQQDSPMDRFLSSSPEDEGISPDAVREAAQSMSRPRRQHHPPGADAASISGSNPSSTSNSSATSVDSVHNRGARRGRKRQGETTKTAITSMARKPSSPSRKYQCTFCTLDFAQKYDWRRHEESVHFPQKEWVCMPDGPVEGSRCVFCNHANPDKSHLKSHKSIACAKAPRTQRAFLRKDKLIQHIKQVHTCQPPKSIKEWCRPIERNVMLACGICSISLSDWATRVDHLASHFNDGINMEMWLLERPGGIITPNHLANEPFKQLVKERLSGTSDPNGQIGCETCSERFTYVSNAIVHRRRVHNTYYPEDRQTMLATGSCPYQIQRDCVDIAQQASRLDLTRMETYADGAAPAGRRPSFRGTDSFALGMHSPIHPQPLRPNPRADHQPMHTDDIRARQSGQTLNPQMPMYGYPGMPSSRTPVQNLSPNPPTDWNYAQLQNTTPSPRLPPSVIPNSQIDPALRHSPGIVPSQGQRPVMVDEMEFAPAYSFSGPPNARASPLTYKETRSIAQRVRSHARASGMPAQGLLHSMEQIDREEAPWPSPFEGAPR